LIESQSKNKRQLASKVLDTIGMALLMLDTTKTFTSQHGFGLEQDFVWTHEDYVPWVMGF